MAKIIELKEDKLIKGGSKEPVYPITVAKAIYDKKNNNLQDIIDYTLPIEYNTRGVNNNLTLAVQAKVQKVDIPNQRIYLNTNQGKAYNPFIHNDVLIMDEYIGGKLVRHYKFTVDTSYFNQDDIYKEDGSINKSRVDWITWKQFIGDPNDIKEGDNLVFRDNLTDINRKGIVTINTIGNNAPNIEVLRGAETRPQNSLKVRIGNLQGINSPSFGELRDYGLYSTNAYLTGDLQLTTGESAETRFKILDNLVSLSMSKTNYQINEENNILVNCYFSNDFEYWIKSQEEQDVYFMQTGDNEDDIIPVFMGDNIFSQNFSTIEKVNIDGKEILRLNNASVEQLNDIFKDRLPQDNIVTEYIKDNQGNIQYDTDGKTPLTQETLIRPKLYLSYRYMCRDGVPYTENGELVKDTNGNVIYKGKITIGFQNSHNITYTESMGDVVALDELGLVSEIADINDGKWVTRQFIAPYDGQGSFIIKVEGDIYIDFFAVTTKPLDNYKDVMTTEFRQTAETIGLYGHRINNLEGSVTDLGIEIDNREEAIKLWAQKELYNDSILTTTLNSLFKITPGTITSLTEKIQYNSEDIQKKYTEVKQDYNGIKTSIYDITYDSEGQEILTIKFYNKTETASYVESILGSGFTPDNPVINSLNNLKNTIDTNKSNTDASINSLNSRISTSEGNIDVLAKWKNDNESNVALISTINTNLSTLTTNYNNTINVNYPNSLAAQIATAQGNISALISWKDTTAATKDQVNTVNKSLNDLNTKFINQLDKTVNGSLAYNIDSAFGRLGVLESWKTDTTGKISELNTAVTTTLPNKITNEVTNTKTEINNGITETLKSYSTTIQTANEITTKVITPLSELGISINGTTRNIAINAKNGTITFNTDNFKLTSDGTLTATNGSFTGSLYTSNGYIGGFVIDGDSIHSENSNIYIHKNGSAKFMNITAAGNISATSGNIGGILINTEGDHGIKSENGNFYITSAGKLFCITAEIRGTIYANNGTIGGIKISNNSISSLNQKFSLTDEGKLTCSNADISGVITATNGSFNGKVTATEGSFKNGTVENCTINTCTITKGCSITNDNGWNLYGDSTGPGWILDGVGIYNVSLRLRYTPDGNFQNITKSLYLNNGADNNYMFQLQNGAGIYIDTTDTAMNITGSSVFNSTVEMLGNITRASGLRVKTYNMSSSGTIPTNVDIVTFTNTSAITVSLPTATNCQGKILYLKRSTSSGVTLKGGSSNNLILLADGTTTSTSSTSVGSGKSMIYISNGTNWIEFYCG